MQSLLFMLDLGKKEDEVRQLLEDEIPLSLLEDCYVAAFSVTRNIVGNAIEPHRTFSHTILASQATTSTPLIATVEAAAITESTTPTKNAATIASSAVNAANTGGGGGGGSGIYTDESVLFDIVNPESYRMLAESMDVQQGLCKYYIDISRYRDATGFLREGLDITQLHFSRRRCTLFLLHQVNADIVASCFSEASARLQLAKNFLRIRSDEVQPSYDADDVLQWRNFAYMAYLELFLEIKKATSSESTLKDLISEKVENFVLYNPLYVNLNSLPFKSNNLNSEQ